MPAPVAPVLDNFNRANENPLSQGGNWAAAGGNPSRQCQLVSNAAQGTDQATSESLYTGTLTDAEAYATISNLIGDLIDDFNRSSLGTGWITAVGTPGITSNQFSSGVSSTSQAHFNIETVTDCSIYATISVLPGAGNGAGVMARASSSAGNSNGYNATYLQGTGVQLFKITGGSTVTQLGSTAAVTLSAGDKIRVTCTGTTITADYFTAGAWTTAVSVTDSTYASGIIGIRLRGTTGRMDNFSGIARPRGAAVRCEPTGSTTQGYAVNVYDDHIDLVRLDAGGALTTLGTYTNTLGVGDKVAVQAIGTTISAWLFPSGGSWSQVITATDSTYASGKSGLRIRGLTAALDDFASGITASDLAVPFISSVSAVYTPTLPVAVPFISSVTVVYTPTTPGSIAVPFIASTTSVHAPTLPVVTAPFISSVTAVYTPTLIGPVSVPFISSVTAVYTPTILHTEVDAPFISSSTVVYTPVVTSVEVDVPFIDSVTIVYTPELMATFTGGGVSQVALEVAAALTDGDAFVSQVTLEIVVPNYKGLHVWQRS